MGRAVPYDRLKMPYYRYEVVKPLRVQAGQGRALVRSAGRRHAIQDRPSAVQVLVERGYLKQVW